MLLARTFVVGLVFSTLTSAFNSGTCRPRRRSVITRLRNRDRPELLIVVGSEADYHSEGILRVAKEAKEAGTPTAWMRQPGEGGVAYDDVEAVEVDLNGLPSPRALQLCREQFVIQPDAFGGSDGFGRGRPMPKRPPLEARCIILTTHRKACIASRAAGMRCVGLVYDEERETLEDVADIWFYDLDEESQPCTFDDLYTPGSFWVNPPVPRTVDGFHTDAWTGEQRTLSGFDAITPQAHARALKVDESPDVDDDGELSEAERAILGDLAPPDADDGELSEAERAILGDLALPP